MIPFTVDVHRAIESKISANPPPQEVTSDLRAAYVYAQTECDSDIIMPDLSRQRMR